MGEATAASASPKLVLGRYRPLRPLGSGGSGSVWLARDEPTGREVALKIVAREGNAGSRAEREAATAARLRHERCLRAYALARDSEHVYIAYEYVPGRTLREVLRGEGLDDRTILELGAQVLEGLAHAHAHGIVHRDVKPSNVLLADGPEPSARLLDFGLALIKEEETLTAVGDVPGTLAYISPERLRGHTASPAADVWSVGVLLWEALAGRHPFWEPSLLETARAIGNGAPALASARPDLPRAVPELVARALSLDPRQRPSAARLASSLRRARRSRRRKTGGSSGRVRGTVSRRWGTGQRGSLGSSGRVRGTVPRNWPKDTGGAAVAAALYAGYSAAALPFFPHGGAPVLAAAAAGLSLLRPRAGLAFALSVPILPLGNLSLGLSLLYCAFAASWLALSWRAPRSGLLLVGGPLLAPLGLLALVPLAAQLVPGRARRALHAAAAVLAAEVVAGISGRALPFAGGSVPGAVLAGVRGPTEAGHALLHALAASPTPAREAAVLGAAAIAISLVRDRSAWWIAALGAGLLVAMIVPSPDAHLLPLVACAWITCGVLVAAHERPAFRDAVARLRLEPPRRSLRAES